jgi:hypothetical protein
MELALFAVDDEASKKMVFIGYYENHNYCMSVFKNESAKEHKLVAPWLNALIIEDQNANDIKITKVSKKDAPNYSNGK